MKKIENQCVGCPPNMGCMGNACPHRNVEVIYCDKCGSELWADEVYLVDGEDLCEDCLKDMFRKGGLGYEIKIC